MFLACKDSANVENYKIKVQLFSQIYFRMIFICIQFASQNEEVVTEAIDVGNHMGVNFCTLFDKGKDTPFCTSADGAAHMSDSSGSASSRENETTEGWQGGVDGIYLLFDTCHHFVCHNGNVRFLTGGVVGWLVVCGKISAHDEKLALNVDEKLDVMFTGTFSDEQSDKGAEFVDGAIRFKTCTSLADSLSTCEGCFPLVACSCVDFHRGNGILEKVILFDAFFVENHHTSLSHVEGDDGAWIFDRVCPKSGVLIVDVLDDENGVWCRSLQHLFTLLCCTIPLGVNDDKGLSLIVVLDAEELSLHGGGEPLLIVGIVRQLFEEYIADEFVCPRRLNTISTSVDGAR